jgi:starvation-inducible DNA-binding protein
VVRELTQRIAEMSQHARTWMDRLGELDAASQDVVIEVVRALEEQQWMLRAQFGGSARTAARCICRRLAPWFAAEAAARS